MSAELLLSAVAESDWWPCWARGPDCRRVGVPPLTRGIELADFILVAGDKYQTNG